jgi:hypothetical protein
MAKQQEVNETAVRLLRELFDGTTLPEELELSQGLLEQDQQQESSSSQAIKDALSVYNA